MVTSSNIGLRSNFKIYVKKPLFKRNYLPIEQINNQQIDVLKHIDTLILDLLRCIEFSITHNTLKSVKKNEEDLVEFPLPES